MALYATGLILAAESTEKSDANWVPLIIQVLILAGLIITVVWGQRHQKNQPKKDSADAEHTGVDSDRLRQTIEKMNEQANYRRDTRLAQLHGYLLLDTEWHLDVITTQRLLIGLVKELVGMVKELGGDVSHIDIPVQSPPPPPIPPPPPMTAD